MRVCSVSVRSGKKIEKIETQFSDSVLFSCVKTSEYNTERNKFQVESKRNDQRKKRGKREEGKGIEEGAQKSGRPLIYSGVEVYGIANLQGIGTDTRAGSYSP